MPGPKMRVCDHIWEDSAVAVNDCTDSSSTEISFGAGLWLLTALSTPGCSAHCHHQQGDLSAAPKRGCTLSQNGA